MTSLDGCGWGIVELTPAGGGLGIVGIAGPEAAALIGKCFCSFRVQPSEQAVGTIEPGCWRHPAAGADGAGRPHREVVVVVRTADESWEIHAHGGRAVIDSIVTSLHRAAAGAGTTGGTTGGRDTPESLLAQRFAGAGGRRAAQILARQLAGWFSEDLAEVDRMLDAAAADRSRSLVAATAILQRLARAGRVGLRLPRPWRVVVRGAVNVGKSSLINSLAGFERSLVSPLAGTTRDLLVTQLVLDGWDVELVDTAGLRSAEQPPVVGVERSGIERGQIAAATADLILDLLPATALAVAPTPAAAGDRPRLVVGTKADLLTATAAAAFPQQPGLILTSAVTGSGVGRLIDAVIARLVPEAAAGLLDRGVPVTPEQLEQVRQRQRRLAALAAR